MTTKLDRSRAYFIKLHYDGVWVANVANMSGCIGTGLTHREALEDAANAMLEWQDADEERNRVKADG